MDYLKEESYELFSQLNHDCRYLVFHFMKGLLRDTKIQKNKNNVQEGENKTNGKI